MAEAVFTRNFQVLIKAVTKPEAFARTIFTAIFPSTPPAESHGVKYPFQQTNEIYWDYEPPYYTEIFGEFTHQNVVLEVRYPADDMNVHLFQINGGGIECKPISVGHNEFCLKAPEAVGHRLLTALVCHLLVCPNADTRLKYLLTGEDPDLVYPRLYQAFWGTGEDAGIALMEEYAQRMPEYEENFVKHIALHLVLKNPTRAVGYLFRAMGIGVAVRGPGAKAEYIREILKAYLNTHEFDAAIGWVNQCCADADLGIFSKAELCIDISDYIQYNRRADADYLHQLRHWANRCADEFKNTRLQRAMAERDKTGQNTV